MQSEGAANHYAKDGSVVLWEFVMEHAQAARCKPVRCQKRKGTVACRVRRKTPRLRSSASRNVGDLGAKLTTQSKLTCSFMWACNLVSNIK
jgi:hypothetical protein